MNLRQKFVIYLLLIASIPLALAMAVALWQSVNQTRLLTLDIVQGYLDAGAEKLSGFFDSRKAEIAAYAQTPLLQGMNFEEIRPFLKSELARHNGTYEKFILGTPIGHFYNTSGGNPAQAGLRTFDDTDPDSKPKTIAKRDYWQYTVGNNTLNHGRLFVSDPMISYTTGAKQIVVAASIKSNDQAVVGMIGGALPWNNFQQLINRIFDEVIKHQNWESRFFLVTRSGVYWYHWDPSHIVHLAKDASGNVKINEIGEKVAAVKKITDSPIKAIADAGVEMINGKRGYTLFNDPDNQEELYLVYAPIESTGYSVGLVVPKSQMMAPVSNLQYLFILILFCAALAVIVGAWILSKRIAGPITDLSKLVRTASDGGGKTNLIPQGNDEVTELTRSFNTLINSIATREKSINELNEELEKRVINRTEQLEAMNNKLKDIEVRQRAILESVVDSLITINAAGIIESVNQATEDMFGYKSEQMVGQNVSMLMPEPYCSEHDSYIENYLTTGHAKVIGIGRELTAKKQDGTVFPIELSLNEMNIGNVKKFAGIVRDISERKQSEIFLQRDSDALKQLNEIAANPDDRFDEKLHKLLKLGLRTFELDLGIVSHICAGDYVVEYIVGPEGAPPVGTIFEFENTYCAHTFAANEPTAFHHVGESELRDHPCYQNFRLESYIGAPIVVNGRRYGTLNFSSSKVHPRPFSTSELTLIQLLAQWIGNELSRSRSEQELGRFKTTLDLTLDCVFMFEPESLKFFYVNQGAINQVGYSQQELVNMHPFDIKPEIDEKDFKELIAPLLTGKKSAINFETLHQHKNGKRLPVEIFLQYINPPGEQPRFVAIVRDITERQQATQQLNSTIEEMTLRTREITLLSSLGDLLHSCQDLPEAYEVVSRFMPMLIPQVSGALYLSRESNNGFERVGMWGKNPPLEQTFPADDCVGVRRGLSYFSKADESALFCKHLPQRKPALSLCLPLAAQGETFGLLHLQSLEPPTATANATGNTLESLQPDFAETVTKQVSMAFASLRLKEQLRNQSIRDPLTGLFNRRYMEETFTREIHRAARNDVTLAVMMIDIDYFKKINDNFGHEAGDAVLEELGSMLIDMTRQEDIACRYGGEEFALCLPGAYQSVAYERAEEIRQAMQNKTFRYNGKPIGTVTLSLGIAVYPIHAGNAADLLRVADQALYEAKRSGRNRSVMAGEVHASENIVRK